MVYRRTEHMAGRIADTRARILEAARAIVAEDGWAGATVSNVADRAGIATGTVYRHWASKADLCVEVVASVSAHEIDVLNQIAAADEPVPDRLHAVIATFLKRALRGRRLAYALIAEPCDPEVEEVRLEYRALIADCIARLLDDAALAGDLHAGDSAVSATCIVGAFMEALIGPLAPFRHHGADDDGAFVEKVTAFCMRAALAPHTDIQTEETPA